MPEPKTTTAANQKGGADKQPPVENMNDDRKTTVDPTNDANRAQGSDDDPTTPNPTVNEGDRLGPLATTSGNSDLPTGTGYHCGICGRVTGKEGQHYDEDGLEAAVPHANVMVVADNWAEKQNEVDQEAADRHAKSRAARRSRAKSETDK